MIGIYCRRSKESDGSRSIEVQQQFGEEFAKSIGESYKVYIDSGISGGKGRTERKGLDNLLNDVEEGIITSIYVYNQDRVARDEATWFEIANTVIKYDIKFYENDKLIDLNEESVFTMRGIKSMFDADERRKTSKRWRDTLLKNAGLGRRFSFIQFGYKEGEDKRLVINEEEAEIVREVFALSLKGVGVSSIAEELNKRGVKTRYAQLKGTYKVKNKYTKKVEVRNKSDVKWKGGTIRGIITNPIYKGQRIWKDKLYPVPAIFEEWYWDKVNENLSNNSNNTGVSVKHSYLLKGLLRCGRCGSNYYGRTRTAKDGKKPKDHYYMCSSKRRGEHNCGNRSINIDALDNIVWISLISDGRLKTILQNYFSDSDVTKTINNLKKQLDEIEGRIEYVKKKKLAFTLKIAELDLDTDDIQSTYESFKAEQLELEKEASNVSKNYHELLSGQLNESALLSELDNLEKLDLDGKRDLLKKCFKNIEILYSDEYQCHFITIELNVYGLEKLVYVYRSRWKYVHGLNSDVNEDDTINYDLMVFETSDLHEEGGMPIKVLSNAKEVYDNLKLRYNG